jgi:hypothetical protein
MQTLDHVLYHAAAAPRDWISLIEGLIEHGDDTAVVSCIASALSHVSEMNNAVYARCWTQRSPAA